MPPRNRSGAASLTPEDLLALEQALAQGKRATVYLREAVPGLGLPAGASARVVSITGSTLLVRPRGVDDELPYETDELRLTKNEPQSAGRPPRKSPPAGKPESRATDATRAPDRAGVAVESVSPRTPVSVPNKPSQAASHPASAPTARPAAATSIGSTAAKPAAPRKSPGARRSKAPTAVSVTLHGTPDNQWSVAVARGTRRPAKATAVPTEAVERAVHELGDTAVSAAVESIVGAAREAAARRVAELSKELEEAKTVLAALGSELDDLG